MIRNILNHLGEVIGQMDLPESTSEADWEKALAPYAAPPPEPVPEPIPDVTPRQIRQALVMAGVSLQQIEDAINSLDEPVRSLARIEWEYSTAFQRNRPLVTQVGAMLGWTDEQLNDLWKTAGKL